MSATSERAKDVGSRPWQMLVVILFAMLAGGAILASFIAWPMFVVQPLPITERDRALLVTAGVFEPWLPGMAVRHDAEQIRKTRLGETGFTLTYQYDRRFDEQPLLVRCTVIIADDTEEGVVAYRKLLRTPLDIEDVEQAPLDGYFSWGKESQLQELRKNGLPCGNALYCRQDKRVYSLVIYGVALNTVDGFDGFSDLVESPLTQLEQYGQ